MVVGVTRDRWKGRLPADIGGGRQAASKIELPSVHLPCLAFKMLDVKSS
jgi:hypothetical protein